MSSAESTVWLCIIAAYGIFAFIVALYHTPQHLAPRYRGKRLKGVARGESWRGYVEKYIYDTEESQ
jgi:hypothetical protein